MGFVAFISVAPLFLAIALAFCGRWHGAGYKDELTGNHTGWPKYGRQISTVVMVLVMAAANYATFGIWWLALSGGVLSAYGFATGHGRFYAMNGANLADPNPEWIERIFGWMYRGDITKPAYSWFCMGIKGLLVGVATAPLGLLLAIVYPAAYWFSFKVMKNESESAEWISVGAAGFLAGLTIVIGVYHG